MSTGGNVPTHGINVQEATTAKKRGDRGALGKGTPGSRLKSAHRKFSNGKYVSLRVFAHALVTGTMVATSNGLPKSDEIKADAKAWLANKGL